MTNYIDWEQQLINLLITSNKSVEKYFDSHLSSECFDSRHHVILKAIIRSHSDGVLLTRTSFIDHLKKYIISRKEQTTQELLFNTIWSLDVNENNFPTICNKVYEAYLSRESIKIVREFNNESKTNGIQPSIVKITDKFERLVSDNRDIGKNTYGNIFEPAKDLIQYWKDVRSGKKQEKEKLLCGIHEIDEAMVTGFAPGTFTLFCADTGTYKSTIMLNIALNVWKQGNDVLFLPLEMSKTQIINRALSRETGISMELFSNFKSLAEEQIAITEETTDKFDTPKNRFYMMNEETAPTSVKKLKRDIEKHYDIFKPKLVVIDYLDLMEPDKFRDGRNDLEIGDMIKALRRMGDAMGFAIISAAQVGREALKRIRKNQEKASFNSEDIRGSHEYSTNSDNLFVLMKDPNQPTAYLQIFVVKTRQGRGAFGDGKIKAILEIKPQIGLVKSKDDYFGQSDIEDVLKKVDDSFDTTFSEMNDGFDDILGLDGIEIEGID